MGIRLGLLTRRPNMRLSLNRMPWPWTRNTLSVFPMVPGVIGIGAIGPNRKEKEHQAQRYADSIGQHIWPARFDESRFERYSVDMADDYNGYLFKLYDKQVEHIGFFVAWVKIEGYKPIEYRRALGNWIG